MLRFDFSRCGLSEAERSLSGDMWAQVCQRLQEEKNSEKPGWWGLASGGAGLCSVRPLADVLSRRFETLVVLGIGGSSQGFKALGEALLPDRMKKNVFVLESPDSRRVRNFLRNNDISKTCFNVISKSGNSAETLALFSFFQEALQKKVGASWGDHFVVTTEKGEGLLFRKALKENLTTLEIPPDVPGRFSVFSAVGLFPLAFSGGDIESLLQGARQADELQALQNGLVHYLLWKNYGKTISVMMPYADALQEFGFWYAQLWAESLGKEGKGQTPLVALGPQAQHSLAQLFLDGPKDKVITVIKVASDGSDPLGRLLHRELEATTQALAEINCPSVTITLPTLDAACLGELMTGFQMQTTFMAHLMGVNAYNQPAVERIKALVGGD